MLMLLHGSARHGEENSVRTCIDIESACNLDLDCIKLVTSEGGESH